MEMRMEVRFKAPILPRRYHFLFTSVIKSAMEISSPDFQKEMYYYGEKSNKQIKPFTGSILLNNYELKNDTFIISGDVCLIISSYDPEFMIHLYNGFITKTEYFYKEFSLSVLQVRFLTEKLPSKNKALFLAHSPIALKGKSGRYLAIDDANYETELNYICNKIINAATRRDLLNPLRFNPVLMKKNIVQLQHDAFQTMNEKSVLYVESYSGTFILEGSVDDLKILTMGGIGNRRSEFFGNIELVNE